MSSPSTTPALVTESSEKKKTVVNLYFPGVLVKGTMKYATAVKKWKCNACPLSKDGIWADLNKGCHNLVNHIQSKHGNQWSDLYEKHVGVGVKPYFDRVSDKAKLAYNFIEQIVMTNQSLSIVDNFFWRRDHPNACSRVTVTNYIMRLANVIYRHIKAEMPDKFGLLLDGWNGNDKTYYIGIYVHYVVDGVLKRPLIAICPPVCETTHSSFRLFSI
jgi:hypothetical protein